MTDAAVSTAGASRRSRLKLGSALTPRIVISLLVMLAMVMLVIPLPVLLIDFMVGLNLLLAIYLLLKTLFVKDSLHLSTFPSLLLLTTVFRLAVSIATTRAILSNGDAGELVRTFGEFVVGGSLVVGLVLFVVIAIVQFVVITKGGERIAEVSARFSLDALPGKQMSIDADLKAGDITKEEARARRKRLSAESEFFGSMDGAMRFVKGDCLATMLIFAVNLIGGLLIGISNGQSIDAALKTYSVLSVGDGLVAQIPSILSCVAAGVLATRVNSEDASEDGVGGDIAGELLRERRSLLGAGLAVGALGLAPGFPAFVLLPLSAVILTALLVPWVKARLTGTSAIAAQSSGVVIVAEAASLPVARFNDPIRVLVHPATLEALETRGLARMLVEKLTSAASDLGCSLHPPSFSSMPSHERDFLTVSVEGVQSARAIAATPENLGSVADALVDVSRSFTAKAFGVDDANEWLEVQSKNFPRLVANVQSQVPGPILAGVMRKVISDGLSIAHPREMLEALLAAIDEKFTVDELTEVARSALVEQIAGKNQDENGVVRLVELSGAWIEGISGALGGAEIESVSAFDAAETSLADHMVSLCEQVDALRKAHGRVVLLAPAHLRAQLLLELRARQCGVAVIAVGEAERIPRRSIVGKIEPIANYGE